MFQAKCLLLRSDNDEFKNDLKCLDACPSRFIQTLHVFYVKDGKTSAVDILQNGVRNIFFSRFPHTKSFFARFFFFLQINFFYSIYDVVCRWSWNSFRISFASFCRLWASESMFKRLAYGRAIGVRLIIMV